MKNDEFVYIYNPHQAQFYFSKGIVPVKVGVGRKGDAYTVFRNDNEVIQAFTEWCTRER